MILFHNTSRLNWNLFPFVLTLFLITFQSENSYCQRNPPKGTAIRDSVIPFNDLPVPVISLSSTADTLCAFPGNLGSYHWYRCGETKVLGTSSCLVIESSGCYCVEGKNALGRTAETCSEFFIAGTAPLFHDAITIVPNPSYGNFHIALSHDSFLPVKWSLLDFTGKEIETGRLEEKSVDLDFSDRPVGLYLITFFSSRNDVEMKRIIITEYNRIRN